MHSLNNRRRTKERKVDRRKKKYGPLEMVKNDRNDYTKTQTSDYTVLNKSLIYIIAFQGFDHICYLT